MAKKRRSRRRSHRRRHARRRSRGLFAMANPFRRRRRSNRHHYRRRNRRIARRNPDFGGWGWRDLLWAGGGAVANAVACRAIPSAIPQLAAYNSGWLGYGINAGFGAAGAWLIGKFNRKAGMGAWIGMVVAVVQRMISDYSATGTVGTGVSGDLDYYSEPFPMPQGSAAGPYPQFYAPGGYYAAGLPVAAAPARIAAGGGGVPGVAPAAGPPTVAGAQGAGPLPGSWAPAWAS